MTSRTALLLHTAGLATKYLETIADRHVGAFATGDDLRRELAVPLSDTGEPETAVIDALALAGALGTVATQGPRYHGFVVGGSVPAATAADWLVSAWDQNAGVYVPRDLPQRRIRSVMSGEHPRNTDYRRCPVQERAEELQAPQHTVHLNSSPGAA